MNKDTNDTEKNTTNNTTDNDVIDKAKTQENADTPSNQVSDDSKSETPMPPKEPIPTASKWSPKKHSLISLLFFIALIIAGILLIFYAWQIPPFKATNEQTDNAFIKGRTTVISPQISGYVTQVTVQDFDKVQAGQVLVKIDDRKFLQQLAQAKANITVANTSLATNQEDTQSSHAVIEARKADLHSAQVAVESARQDVTRYQGLISIGAISQEQFAHAQNQLSQAQAAAAQAKANLQTAIEAAKKTTTNKNSLNANIASAKAAEQQAQLNLDNTIITAPESGQLSQVNVKVGQFVTAGTQMMYIVPQGVWVIANFKETQIHKIHIGETATIKVDALGGQAFTGVVSNISPATGSEFSIAAPNPATGNYIKVPQRIPVRIDLDPNQKGINQLRPGMSVVASVDTKDNPKPAQKS